MHRTTSARLITVGIVLTASLSCLVSRDARACIPSCSGRLCGGDGCGALCGVCPSGRVCQDGACVPAAGCGALPAPGECQTGATASFVLSCQAGQVRVEDCNLCHLACGVDAAGRAACVACRPACEGRACGDDGCGGLCGSCAFDEACVGHGCQPASQCAPPVCNGDQLGICLADWAGVDCALGGGTCGTDPGTGQAACLGCTATCASLGLECGEICGQSCGRCAAGRWCRDGRCVEQVFANTCTRCASDLDCLTAEYPRCDVAESLCVECLTAADCAAGETCTSLHRCEPLPSDGGVQADAGPAAPDAANGPDGAPPDGAGVDTGTQPRGCSCSGAGVPAVAWMWWVPLALRRGRRRARSTE